MDKNGSLFMYNGGKKNGCVHFHIREEKIISKTPLGNIVGRLASSLRAEKRSLIKVRGEIMRAKRKYLPYKSRKAGCALGRSREGSRRGTVDPCVPWGSTGLEAHGFESWPRSQDR